MSDGIKKVSNDEGNNVSSSALHTTGLVPWGCMVKFILALSFHRIKKWKEAKKIFLTPRGDSESSKSELIHTRFWSIFSDPREKVWQFLTQAASMYSVCIQDIGYILCMVLHLCTSFDER